MNQCTRYINEQEDIFVDDGAVIMEKAQCPSLEEYLKLTNRSHLIILDLRRWEVVASIPKGYTAKIYPTIQMAAANQKGGI